ncbi:MAG: C4-type zinc ribbon domain-containing protein [Cyclobacteriaceae bacterium]|nr:hypothetical protein [Cyclobacteriaceae bacterium]MCH8517065.1 C4-type zinc ribbon domain-containing protein [Cyclobacteriaceae bacterium]
MEKTVAQKLDSLLKLQSLDSQLDELIKLRGALPEEVSDLEDDVAQLDTRIERYQEEIKELENEIQVHKNNIKTSEALITKYNEQQDNVRNNREFEAITKEIELQGLEIQLSEKKIKEVRIKIEVKENEIQLAGDAKTEREADLADKRNELNKVIADSTDEEQKIIKSRDKVSKDIEERLLTSYEKLRKNAANGLAVVKVDRGACGGCFNTVPPQRQSDIREKKKLIVCEHCGRILADVVEEVEEEKPKKRTVRKKKTPSN